MKVRVYQAWEPDKGEFSRQRSSRLIKVDDTQAREHKDFLSFRLGGVNAKNGFRGLRFCSEEGLELNCVTGCNLYTQQS